MLKVRRALISVSSKESVVDFASGLADWGVQIISTSGTAKVLRESGLEVTDISNITGFPEILDGRVKALHPKIHGGLLYQRDKQEHIKTIVEQGIAPIDMVVVNLYRFQDTALSNEITLQDALEQIDIGGHSLIRSGVKNYQSVAVITNPSRYRDILEEMMVNDGQISEQTLSDLAVEAFELTSLYDIAIHGFLQQRLQGKQNFPHRITMGFTKMQDLRYGENPHQKAAFYHQDRGSGQACIAGARQLNGKELSYNNIVDMDAALNVVKEFSQQPAVAIIKHANPCGAAIVTRNSGIEEAFLKALDSDPMSAFGGVVASNRPINLAMAQAIGEIFLECIIAPSFEDDALDLLRKKDNLRLLEFDNQKYAPWPAFEFAHDQLGFKEVTGGLLLQDLDLNRIQKKDCTVVTDRQPEDSEWRDILFAWKVIVHVNSNAILIAKDGRTVGVGQGQSNRVGSVKIAVQSAGTKAQGAVLASDAFFPFRDGVDKAAEAGIKTIIQQGGSRRDDEVIKAANEHGIAMVFTGERHFSH